MRKLSVLLTTMLFLAALCSTAGAYNFYGQQPSWFQTGAWIAAEWNTDSANIWVHQRGMNPSEINWYGMVPEYFLPYPPGTPVDPPSPNPTPNPAPGTADTAPWLWSGRGIADHFDTDTNAWVPDYITVGKGLLIEGGMPNAQSFDMSLGNQYSATMYKKWYWEITLNTPQDDVFWWGDYSDSHNIAPKFTWQATYYLPNDTNDYDAATYLVNQGVTNGVTYWAEFTLPIQPLYENFQVNFKTVGISSFYVTHMLVTTSCTPEPSSFALMGLACCLPVGFVIRRRKRTK